MATVPTSMATEQQMLTGMLRTMFPHPSIADAPYERCAAEILETAESDPRVKGQLLQGLVDLDARSGGSFGGLHETAALEVLEAMAGTPFFEAVRAKAILTLYNDTEVWRALGYEGASYQHGGYLDRGYGDLDWLPEPSLGEVRG
jgi:hypothetical protein